MKISLAHAWIALSTSSEIALDVPPQPISDRFLQTEFRTFLNKSCPRFEPAAEQSERLLWVISRPFSTAVRMSAFGGKADVNHFVGECPLLAIRRHPKHFALAPLVFVSTISSRPTAPVQRRIRAGTPFVLPSSATGGSHLGNPGQKVLLCLFPLLSFPGHGPQFEQSSEEKYSTC